MTLPSSVHCGQLHSIEIRQTVKGWNFPLHRFIVFDADDEKQAVSQRWSGWGGEPCEREQKIVFPKAILKRLTVNGVEFVAIPDYSVPIVNDEDISTTDFTFGGGFDPPK